MNRQLLIYYDSLSNEALCKSALKDGDELAFQVLYKRTFTKLLVYALKLHKGDREAASDSVHEFWLTLFESKPDVRNKFISYAITAIKQNYWETYRKRKAKKRDAIIEKFDSEEELERAVQKKMEVASELSILLTKDELKVAKMYLEGYTENEVKREIVNAEKIIRRLKDVISILFARRKPPIL